MPTFGTRTMLITPFEGFGDIDSLASLDEETPNPLMDNRAKLGMPDAHSPHVMWMKILIPWLFVLLMTASAWLPWLCRQVRSTFCCMRSALSIRNLRATLQERRPELLSISLAGLVACIGVLLGPGGHIADDKTLPEQDVEMRQLWPVLLHPDSLLVLQQLLRASGASLFILRGVCETCGGAFGPALLQMALGSATRLILWGLLQDYQLEGPLGGRFAICIVALTFLVQFLAACKAIRVAYEATEQRKRFLYLKFCFQLTLAIATASANHFTLGRNTAADVAFTVIDAGDVSATPLFTVASCLAATDNVVSICPALICLFAAQILGFSWFLDFLGLYSGFTSSGGDEDFKNALLVVKASMVKSAYGNPVMLLFTSHSVQLFLISTSLLGAIGIQRGYFHAMFSSMRPKGASKAVIEKLETVPYAKDMFANGDDAAQSNECCAICLAEFEVGEELRRLPCQHQQFHASCVDLWLARAGRCPLCVASVDDRDNAKVA